MLVHRTDWKGSSDGIEALRIVRQRVPGLEVALFGPTYRRRWERWLLERPLRSGQARTESLKAPGRAEVGALLRRVAVYVQPSWEEGFGMPGLEALLCGASLATTDTRGSRDYAIDGETALVSGPRDPPSLANNIERLITDADYREQLAVAGCRCVTERFTTWDRAAAHIADWLAQQT
jgi:glycosyltransferase involved in cell wall biosynthesis